MHVRLDEEHHCTGILRTKSENEVGRASIHMSVWCVESGLWRVGGNMGEGRMGEMSRSYCIEKLSRGVPY